MHLSLYAVQALSEIGGKGLFCKELDVALLNGDVRCMLYNPFVSDPVVIAIANARCHCRFCFLCDDVGGYLCTQYERCAYRAASQHRNMQYDRERRNQ